MADPTSHQGAESLDQWKMIFRKAGFTVDRIIPDQWPWLRWFYLLHLFGLKINLQHFPLLPWPLSISNEFIFLLSKSG